MNYALAALVGKGLAGIRLSDVRRTTEPTSGSVYYLKARRWYSDSLIRAGSMVGPRHPRLFFLLRDEWLAWERQVRRVLYGETIQVDARKRLRLLPLHGIVLSHYLESNRHDNTTTLPALAAAMGELKDLHAVRLRFPDGGPRSFSHADATARNIYYDPATNQARWFDFETVHAPHLSSAWRHADDLRALIFSAAASLPPEVFPQVARLLIETYNEADVLRELSGMTRKLRDRPDPIHLAQAAMTFSKQTALIASLLRELEPYS